MGAPQEKPPREEWQCPLCNDFSCYADEEDLIYDHMSEHGGGEEEDEP